MSLARLLQNRLLDADMHAGCWSFLVFSFFWWEVLLGTTVVHESQQQDNTQRGEMSEQSLAEKQSPSHVYLE